MKSGLAIPWALALGLLLISAVHAAPPPAAQAEIKFLLAAVASSDCDFYRNGSWYAAKRAEAHLRAKYDYLVSGNLIGTTEEFIERGATRSSWSGRDYAIRCRGHETVPSSQWLLEQLARYRKLDKTPLPSGTQFLP